MAHVPGLVRRVERCVHLASAPSGQGNSAAQGVTQRTQWRLYCVIVVCVFEDSRPHKGAPTRREVPFPGRHPRDGNRLGRPLSVHDHAERDGEAPLPRVDLLLAAHRRARLHLRVPDRVPEEVQRATRRRRLDPSQRAGRRGPPAALRARLLQSDVRRRPRLRVRVPRAGDGRLSKGETSASAFACASPSRSPSPSPSASTSASASPFTLQRWPSASRALSSSARG